MDERDIVLNSVLEELKNKKLITELEKDIVDAIKVFLEQPIDRNSIKTKINEIDLKYNTYSDLLIHDIIWQIFLRICLCIWDIGRCSTCFVPIHFQENQKETASDFR